MADPLSITASIVAVVQISSIILKSLGNLKDTPGDLRRLRRELDGLQSVLLPALERLKRHEEDMAMIQLLNAHAPLEEFRILLEHLKKKLASVVNLNKARRAVAWQFQKGEFKSILGTIERQKTLFVLALQSGNYSMLQDTRNLCNSNHHGIVQLAEGVAELRKDSEGEGMSCDRDGTSCDGERPELWGTVIHYGNNFGGSNVIYGGTQIFSGATISFGKT